MSLLGGSLAGLNVHHTAKAVFTQMIHLELDSPNIAERIVARNPTNGSVEPCYGDWLTSMLLRYLLWTHPITHVDKLDIILVLLLRLECMRDCKSGPFCICTNLETDSVLERSAYLAPVFHCPALW